MPSIPTFALWIAEAAAAPPSEEALAELLQAGGFLDQMAWLEERLPAVEDPEERAGWKRVWDALMVASEELGTGAPPQGWYEVVRVAADPPSPEALRAILGAWLLGTTPEGRAPMPADRYREGRLTVLHPVFDYYAVEVGALNATAWGTTAATADVVIREHRYDEVLFVDGSGQDVEFSGVADRLAALGEGDEGRWTRARARKDEGGLRAALQRLNQALALELGLDAATVEAVESGEIAPHWSETLPLCPSRMPPLYVLFHGRAWTREIEVAAQQTAGLGEICRAPSERHAPPDPEPED